VIVGIHDGSPFDHLVDFFYPCAFTEALLKNDAGFVTFEACCCGFSLHGASRKSLGAIGGWLLSQGDEWQNHRAEYERCQNWNLPMVPTKVPTLRQAQGKLSRAKRAREMGHPFADI
jgi:hypothetical protein